MKPFNILLIILSILSINDCYSQKKSSSQDLVKNFLTPPDAARPGVYWYFMDGNLNGKEMTADLEAMKQAGIGNLVFLEVNVGVPKGPVKWMTNQWQDLFVKTVRDAERLGIDITLGIGPGWCGSGGPWVKPEQAMQHLVFSSIDIKGPNNYSGILPMPAQRSTNWHKMSNPFYEDVATFAFPTKKPIISDINEKALFERSPYSSSPNVKPYLPTSANYTEPSLSNIIAPTEIVNLTSQLKSDGSLGWKVPDGDWTIVRMGRRVTGADTRPAPEAAMGLESDKFSAKALNDHLDNFVGVLLNKINPRTKLHGLTTLHMDSWESGAQNWSPSFLDEFKKRRSYNAEPYLLTYTGRAVESLEKSERFLWDLRLTGQELILDNHAQAVKQYAHKNGLELSIEPYDMNPSGDLDLGAIADVPMAEFWNKGFNSSFSVFESSSIAHLMGKSIVSAESFTSSGFSGALDAYPWTLKNQGDWAFAAGINRFVFHTYAHQALGDTYKPGMTMGPYGVHWHRNQTWWPMVSDYHLYLSRCSQLLRQGVAVNDILYLTPEGAPQVFRAPETALEGSGPLVDKKGYGFDGCSPKILMARAEVKNGLIVFPGGSSYRIMVLPQIQTMTPQLLAKIRDLVKAGATIIGTPPLKSPSLVGYPACDLEVQKIAIDLWGKLEVPKINSKHNYGKGSIYWGGELTLENQTPLYPSYDLTANILKEIGVVEDFTATGPVRYNHRQTEDRDIYFISNRTANQINANCSFRVGQANAQLWNPVTGERLPLSQFERKDGTITIPIEFDAYQSYFVLFGEKETALALNTAKNFTELAVSQELTGAWDLAFDPKWGGPEKIVFNTLQDWTTNTASGIKYYSGIATYKKAFSITSISLGKTYLSLGEVHDMARVKLNGKDLGVVWCAPFRVEVTSAIKSGVNQLEIEVVNRWPNRMIGDKQPADANVREVQTPLDFLGGKKIITGRYTFSTNDHYKIDTPLLPSGLLGPVQILISKN